MPETTYLVSRPLWVLSSGLLATLEKFWHGRFNMPFNVPEGRPWAAADGEGICTPTFMLDPGMGPTVMLTIDGRIVWEDAALWGVQGTLREALLGVVVGIKKFRVMELAELLPVRPDGSLPCSKCIGGVIEVGPYSMICMDCAGLGWTDESVDLTASVLMSRMA